MEKQGDAYLTFKKEQKEAKAEINTSESIEKKIIANNGLSVDEFTKLLHPDRILNDNEKRNSGFNKESNRDSTCGYYNVKK